ncbi:hypothetical protein Mal33_53870 [Rosistilla oblonga]|uniref:Uncharacterized protein n=1 Tax=Rosistilla oblonga TaxID=2527990 RepID=A0A518J1Z5_9BACT|nr:hypothetical protein Mal33_53870 [Rosistilla oblonga]
MWPKVRRAGRQSINVDVGYAASSARAETCREPITQKMWRIDTASCRRKSRRNRLLVGEEKARSTRSGNAVMTPLRQAVGAGKPSGGSAHEKSREPEDSGARGMISTKRCNISQQ